MSVDGDKYRRGLRNSLTRASVIDTALDAGKEYVDATVELLSDPHDGVRWSAVRILSEIGDERAVSPLIELLESGRNALEVADALRSITGQKLEDDAVAWRRWAAKKPALGVSSGAGGLSDEELLQAAISKLPATVSGDGPLYAVKVTLSQGRSQQIWVDFSVKDSAGEPLVQLCTPCGAADEARYEWALKMNMTILYGAMALALLDEELYFAMVNNHLRATVHPEDLEKSIMTLAREGDAAEKLLQDGDQY